MISKQWWLNTNKSVKNHEEIRRRQSRIAADAIFIYHHSEKKRFFSEMNVIVNLSETSFKKALCDTNSISQPTTDIK